MIEHRVAVTLHDDRGWPVRVRCSCGQWRRHRQADDPYGLDLAGAACHHAPDTGPELRPLVDTADLADLLDVEDDDAYFGPTPT